MLEIHCHIDASRLFEEQLLEISLEIEEGIHSETLSPFERYSPLSLHLDFIPIVVVTIREPSNLQSSWVSMPVNADFRPAIIMPP